MAACMVSTHNDDENPHTHAEPQQPLLGQGNRQQQRERHQQEEEEPDQIGYRTQQPDYRRDSTKIPGHPGGHGSAASLVMRTSEMQVCQAEEELRRYYPLNDVFVRDPLDPSQRSSMHTNSVVVYDPCNRLGYLLHINEVLYNTGKELLWKATFNGETQDNVHKCGDRKRFFLCMLFQDNRCKGYQRCNNIHLDRARVAQFRARYQSRARSKPIEHGLEVTCIQVPDIEDPGRMMDIRVGSTLDTTGRVKGMRGEPVRLCPTNINGEECSMGLLCRDIHLRDDVIRAFRVSCCVTCSPTTHEDRTFLRRISTLRLRVKLKSDLVTIDPAHLGITDGLKTLCREHPDVSDFEFPRGKFCHRHLNRECKYGYHCNNIHVCRKEFSNYFHGHMGSSGSYNMGNHVYPPGPAATNDNSHRPFNWNGADEQKTGSDFGSYQSKLGKVYQSGPSRGPFHNDLPMANMLDQQGSRSQPRDDDKVPLQSWTGPPPRAQPTVQNQGVPQVPIPPMPQVPQQGTADPGPTLLPTSVSLSSINTTASPQQAIPAAAMGAGPLNVPLVPGVTPAATGLMAGAAAGGMTPQALMPQAWPTATQAPPGFVAAGIMPMTMPAVIFVPTPGATPGATTSTPQVLPMQSTGSNTDKDDADAVLPYWDPGSATVMVKEPQATIPVQVAEVMQLPETAKKEGKIGDETTVPALFNPAFSQSAVGGLTSF